MWRVTLKGLLAHKLRLTLTALAIVLGVTFISGTFVLTDTLHNTFSNLIGNIYAKVDLQVRGVAQFSHTSVGQTATRNPIPESLISTVEAVPGVKSAEGGLTGYAQFVSPEGKAISGTSGSIGLSYDPDPDLSSLHLVAGSAPTGPNDVVMDAGTAKKYHFSVGQQVKVLLAGPTQTFTVVGIVKFGTADNIAGASIAAFALHTAQQVLDEPGHLDDINILTTPGSDVTTVQNAVQAAMPAGVQVVTGKTVANEQTDSVDQALGIFNTALLVFAFISLFVGAFTIFNTFSIIVGQRTRELALLRIVGASRRQVFRSVLAEAALVGLVASIIGLGAGIGAAVGLEGLLRVFGITFPSASLVFRPRTAVIGLLVGVGVTVIAAISPARRAVRISPIEAISLHQADAEISGRRRLTIGGFLGLAGIVLLAIGLAASKLPLVGIGAAAIFLAAAMLAPVFARPVSSVIGRPLARWFGTPGQLGRENSMRSPKRTAQTASALMIGLALVSAITVFGASLSKSATSSVDQAISADLIITNSSQSQPGISNSIAALVAKVPGVTVTDTAYDGQVQVGDSLEDLTAVGTSTLAQTIILRMQSGSAASLDSGDLLVDATTASSKHLHVGDALAVKYAKTGTIEMRIGGVFATNALLGSYVVSNDFFLSHFDQTLPIAVLARTTGPSVEPAVTTALAAFPNAQIQSKAEFEKSQKQQVDKLLGLVYALLALAVIIALIGIINTLMLSVFERTREVGLLRAVGMTRRQIRSMVRVESVILALFGALIGIVIGTGLGVALVSSLHSKGISETSVPIPELIGFLVLAALLGLFAATFPARRAARLDVLAAIATD
ncbi:MAG TPA: FtsX-like permease family protein [Mycobacteriales bacterium]|jgi:putative ABC transport system permease protein|nr:FtsX-like permease family protein [Mycobacteriales bacterium]